MKKPHRLGIFVISLSLTTSLMGNLPTEDDTKCKCENGEIIEVPVNECIDVRIGFGQAANEPETDLKAFFQVYAMKPSPVVFSPQGLQYHNLILTPLNKVYLNSKRLTEKRETIDNVVKTYYVDSSNNRYEADQVLSDLPSNINRKVQIFTYNRELLEYIFYVDNNEAKVSRNPNNLQYVMKMVNANGDAVTDNPVYFDMYHNNGDFIRYSALDGKVVSYHKATGRVITPSTPTVGLEVISDEGNIIRQIFSTADGLADIVITEPNNKYEIRLYTPDRVGAKSDGLYTVSGAAHTIWKFEKANAVNNNHLKVTKVTDNNAEEFNYSYSSAVNDWLLIYPDNLTITSKSSSWDYSKTVKSTTKMKTSSDGKVALKETEITQKFSFGERMITTILDPDGANLKTSYTYTNNGLTASVSNHDGYWTAYGYDSNDRIIKTKVPWKNSPFNSVDENCTVIHTSYENQDSRDIVLNLDNRPRVRETKTLGITTAKSMYAFYFDDGSYHEVEENCVNPTAQWGDSSNLRVIKRYYSSNAGDASSGRLEKITNPNGTTESYTYEYGNWSQSANPAESSFTPGNGAALRISKIHGTASSAAGIAFKTTKETTIYDTRGNVVQREVYVYDGNTYEKAAWEVMTYNNRNQMTAKYFSNNTYETYVWNCCNKESETLADGTQYTYTYDALKRMISETKVGIGDQPDLVTAYEYDAADRLVKETISGGDLSVFSATEYNPAGQIIKQIDQQGLITTYSYLTGINSGNNLRGQTTTTINPGGFTAINETFCDGKTLSRTGTAQIVEYYEYGINSDGSSWTLTRTGGGNSPRYTKTTTNLLNQILEIEKPGIDGIFKENQFYNGKNQIVKKTATGNPDILYIYDSLGRLIRSGVDVNANGTLDLESSDRINDVESIYFKKDNDWWGQETQSTFGSVNNTQPTILSIKLIRLTGFTGEVISEQKITDIYGNITSQTTRLNRTAKKSVTETLYSDSNVAEQHTTVNGLLKSTRSKSNLINTYVYDALERQISINDARTGQTQITYHTVTGKIGQLQSTVDPAGNTTDYDYDVTSGRLLWERNALNKYTRYAYNDRGQIIQTWGDSTYPIMFAYNQFGEQINMWTFRTNADWSNQTWPQSVIGDQTTWNYDPASGLLLSKTDAAGKSVTYNYSPDGKLTKRTWARGLFTDYQYDALGQLLKIDYSDDTPDITYAYNRIGQLTSVQDAAGARIFGYNEALDLISETINGIYNKTITRTHTTTGAKGKILSMAVDGTNNYIYGYDQYGRLNKITTSAGDFNYSYLANSNLISQMTRPNDVNTTWSYEPNRNLITQVQNGTISTFGYTNDAIGRRTAMSRGGSAFTAPDTLNYTYDTRSQVTEAISNTDNNYNYNYTYDPIGNRLTANNTEYTSNALNQYTQITPQLPNSPTPQFSYDVDGNMLTNNGWSYTWNAENRLSKAEKDTTKLEFTYDYMGRRISKKVYEGDTITKHTRFIYDNYKLVEELDASNENAIIKRYTWQPEGVGLDIPLQVHDVAANQTYYYLHDANKNVSQLTNSTGNTIAHYEYDPFANQTKTTGAYAKTNLFRFSSEYYDNETSLIYYNYRYYDTKLGRWTKRDPIEEEGGWNLYNILKNSSINTYDIKGLWGGAFANPSAYKNDAIQQQQNQMNPQPTTSSSGILSFGGSLNILLSDFSISVDENGCVTLCWSITTSLLGANVTAGVGQPITPVSIFIGATKQISGSGFIDGTTNINVGPPGISPPFGASLRIICYGTEKDKNGCPCPKANGPNTVLGLII